MTRIAWLTLAAAVFLFAVAPAFGAARDKSETKADAKSEALIRQGLQMRRNGDDQGAERVFRQAYDLSHSARSAAQLGFCRQALGSWVDAEGYLTEALRATDDPWIKKNLDTIRSALVIIKSHIARVEVTGDPPGAEVLVNGSVVGKLPLGEPVRIASGEIEIALRAPGFKPLAKTLHVQGNQTHRLELRAERATADSDREREAGRQTPPLAEPSTAATAVDLSVAAPPQESGGSDTQVVAAAQPATAGSQPASSSAGRRSLKFVSWGLAAAAVGVGVFGQLRNSTLVNEFDSGCGVSRAGVPQAQPGAPAEFTDARCADLKHRYQQATTISIVGLAAGGVLAATGFVLWLTEPSSSETRTAALTCAPGFLPAVRPQLACGFRF